MGSGNKFATIYRYIAGRNKAMGILGTSHGREYG